MLCRNDKEIEPLPNKYLHVLPGVKVQHAQALAGRRATSRIARRAPIVRAAVQAPAEGPIIIDGQVLHSITSERLDVVKSLDDFASNEVPPSP